MTEGQKRVNGGRPLGGAFPVAPVHLEAKLQPENDAAFMLLCTFLLAWDQHCFATVEEGIAFLITFLFPKPQYFEYKF